MNYINLLKKFNLDFLLINATNEYLVEYSNLSENARYTLTGFSGSTGDALISKDKIYLFVDGRYHIQADNEVFDNITVIKLPLNCNQDDEIKKIVGHGKLGIISKKVSQQRFEYFSDLNCVLLNEDPINNYTEKYSDRFEAVNLVNIKFDKNKTYFITNLEEVSYITNLRNFEKQNSSKIYAKLLIHKGNITLFKQNDNYENFLKNFKNDIYIDKSSISAYDYKLIEKPIHEISKIKTIKSIKVEKELDAYHYAFSQTDKTILEIRNFIVENDNISEFDIATKLKELFYKNNAKCLSFNPIVAINKHSALAHYSNNDKNTVMSNGSLVLIDCGAYYESGLATDITRVFIKGKPSLLQKQVYTLVLKSFLNTFFSKFDTGYEYNNLAHKILDNKLNGFIFNHGLGHGIGINVHESPPNLSYNEIAKTKILNNMTYTIEPGLYNKDYFGIRLENSCYRKNNKNYSFTKVGYEKILIDFSMLTQQEIMWLKDFELYENN